MYHGQKVLATLELENEVEVEFLESGTISLSREQLNHEGEVSHVDSVYIGKEQLKTLLEMSEQIYGHQ
jgi:hypothetical protein